jgi:hypothetical protein
MPWRISYRHPLRADDGGIRFVPDQSEAAAEKLRLELRGYVVSTPTQAAALRLIAQTEEVFADEAAEAPLVRVYTASPGSVGSVRSPRPQGEAGFLVHTPENGADRREGRKTRGRSMGKLDGKVAIVTGSACGLGGAYANRLAGLGAKVAVTDLNLHSYEEFEAEAKGT